uniref:Glucuronosyltransferase n=1 Tax=Heterorhabditis bacteriophora TaxID=37862 RepID=A0A1I7X259_HETBA
MPIMLVSVYLYTINIIIIRQLPDIKVVSVLPAFLMKHNEKDGILARWIMGSQGYDTLVEHLKESSNMVADCHTRG